MNAIPAAGMPANVTADRVRRAAVLLALISLMAGPQAAAQEQATAQGRTPAVLKRQEVDFFYHSSLVRFSCSGLQGRVASILRALGARDDVNVRITDCQTVIDPLQESMDGTWDDARQMPSDRWRDPADRWRGSTSHLRNQRTRREQSAHVRADMMMPVEVTPEVLEEIKKDKSRRDLISRVTGNANASLDDPIIFPAQRQLVTLSHKTLDLQPEECELLEQMSASVFPKLDIRVVRRSHSCDRDQVSLIPPQLTVEALMPVMPEDPQLHLVPAPAEDKNSDPATGAPAASGTSSSQPATAPKPE